MATNVRSGRTRRFGERGLFGLKPVLGGAPGRVTGAVEKGGDIRRWRIRKVSPGEEKDESYGDEEKEETKEWL